MKEHFIELFDYNRHANQKLLALVLAHQPDISEKTQQLINHLINAHQIWASRINGATPFEVWRISDWNDLVVIDNENHVSALNIIAEHDLNEAITYINSKGEKFTSSINDILFHVINHSTYHRAQIASDLRESAITPVNTDYIFYRRSIDKNDNVQNNK